MDRPQVILIANNKGGTGKTLSSVCIAANFAASGGRTLIIDNQSGGCTDILFSDLLNSPGDISTSQYHEDPMIFPTAREGLDLCCSNTTLLYEFKRADVAGLSILDVDLNHYSFVVIDSLSNSDPFEADKLYMYYLLSRAHLLLPLRTEYLASTGPKVTLFYYMRAKKYLEQVRLMGGFLNGFSPLDRVAAQTAENYKEAFKQRLFWTVIRDHEELRSSPSLSGNPKEYPPPLLKEYEELTREILQKLGTS